MEWIYEHIILVLLEALIIGVLILCVFKEIQASRDTGIVAVVKRGDKSLNKIFASYFAALSAATLVVSMADGTNGDKLALMALNCLFISYIFLFNSWFRNRLIAFIGYLRKD